MAREPLAPGEEERLQQALDLLRGGAEEGRLIAAWRRLPAQAAVQGEVPAALDARLARLLAELGIQGLYSHQAEAVAAALAGQDVAVVTPTASGKTLCYTLPVLQALLRDPERPGAVPLPTKALANDQWHSLAPGSRRSAWPAPRPPTTATLLPPGAPGPAMGPA